MKKFIAKEKDTTTVIEASSFQKAAAQYFGVERPVRVMSQTPNEFGNHRYSKNRIATYRSAVFARA